MPVTPEDLAKKAMEMPSEERARLADLLVESLDDAPLNEIDRAWAEEAKRRLTEVRAGKVKTIPGEEAFQQVRDSLKK
jgi:putative addiction module component (TIGR02574 family)